MRDAAFLIKEGQLKINGRVADDEGSIADQASDLWKIKKSSTGLGFRLATSSQFVYRIDLASGQEGNEFIFWFDYPWGAVQ